MGISYAGVLCDNKDMDVTCPVLILMGEYDKTGKVKQYCRKWAEKTGYPLHIVKNAAHNANVDNPDDVNYIIKKFLMNI